MAAVLQFQQINLPGQAATRPKLFSNGCLMCLKRRVKCDETKPTCTRCEKIKAICPGYRNPLKLIFRDMTKVTERQAHKSKCPKRDSNDYEKESHQKLVVTKPAVVQAALTPNLEHQGISYFVDNYVFPGKGPRPGYLDFVPELLQSKDAPSFFGDILAACGVAALAIHQSRPDFLRSARKYSASALHAMGKAMKDPELVKSDHLLAASFLCSKYQMISGDSEELFETHGQGQLALLKLRGPDQATTKVGRALLFMVGTRASTRSLVELEPMSPLLKQLMTPSTTQHDPMARMSQLLGMAMSWMFRAKQLVIEGHSTSMIDVMEIAQNLMEIDRDLQDWFEKLPPFLLPITLKNESSLYYHEVDTSAFIPFLEKVLVFEDIFHSGHWARYVSGRLQLLRVLYLSLAYCKVHGVSPDVLPVSTDNLEEASEAIDVVKSRLQRFVHWICMMAPYMSGKLKASVSDLHPLKATAQSRSSPTKGEQNDVRPRTSSQLTPPDPKVSMFPNLPGGASAFWSLPASDPRIKLEDVFPEPPSGESPQKALGSFWLMYLLYLSGLVNCLSPEYYPWFEARLWEIGHIGGIKQAISLLENFKSLRGAMVGFSCF